MMQTKQLLASLAPVILFYFVDAQKFSFKPVQMDEADSTSPHMPNKLKCDGCHVIAFKLHQMFEKAHSKKKSLKFLPESDIIDIVDKVCTEDYKSYGVKSIDGKPRLTGPGLEASREAGIMQGGGMWPNRLRNMCSNYAEEVGEYELYTGYVNNKENFTEFLCNGSGVRGYCTEDSNKKNKKLERKEEL